MQKVISLSLACMLGLGLVACGGSSGGSKKSNSSSSVSSSAVVASSLQSSVSSEQASSVDASSSVDTSSSIDASSSAEASSSSANSQSSSTSSSTSSNDASGGLTGIFVDSAVVGIGYKTETKSGFTNENGEYNYAEGETVTFFIGALELPPVPAKGVLTPLDLAGTSELNNQVVLNIAILLQSLDEDGDPSNGITIDYEAVAETAVQINFDQSTNSFSTAIGDLVAAADTSLVTEEAASEHLQTSLDNLESINAKRLIGTWYMHQQDEDDNYYIIIAFLDETRYIAIDIDGSEGTDIEAGTYSWDVETGVVSVNIRVDNNDQLGFSDGTYRILKSGNELLMSEDGTGEDPVPMIKLSPDSDSSILGGWYMQEEGVDVLIAFTEDQYFMGQYSAPDEVGNAGVETGSYTYNAETKEIRFDTQRDDNGQWGFSHPCAVLDIEGSNDLSCGLEGKDILQTLTRSGNQLVFVSQADTLANGGEEQPVTLEAVGNN